MDITYDSTKDAINTNKHGVSLRLANQLEWESAVIWPDTRKDYGEPRMGAIGYIGLRWTMLLLLTETMFDVLLVCVRQTKER